MQEMKERKKKNINLNFTKIIPSLDAVVRNVNRSITARIKEKLHPNVKQHERSMQ